MEIRTDNSAVIAALEAKVVELELLNKAIMKRLQTAQADKIAAISTERKRWARQDLEAIAIDNLEQQAKGISELQSDCACHHASGSISSNSLSKRVRLLKNKAEALKESSK